MCPAGQTRHLSGDIHALRGWGLDWGVTQWSFPLTLPTPTIFHWSEQVTTVTDSQERNIIYRNLYIEILYIEIYRISYIETLYPSESSCKKKKKGGHFYFTTDNMSYLCLTFSLNVMRFIHNIVYIINLFFFSFGCWKYHKLGIHSTVDRHTGCFQFGAVRNIPVCVL